jgi:hypothetical protein
MIIRIDFLKSKTGFLANLKTCKLSMMAHNCSLSYLEGAGPKFMQPHPKTN